MPLKCLFKGFDGGRVVIVEKFIGKIWRHYANTNLKEDWVSKIWSNSMKRCWPNKCGGCIWIGPHYFSGCLVLNSSHQDWCSMQKAQKVLSHGKVFSRQGLSLRKGCYGESGMANRFACFLITGFLVSSQQK